jgi:hypothetical protein
VNAELLKSQIIEYSSNNSYLAEHFVVPKCSCGCSTFTLLINADEGVAARICTSCESDRGIGDSDDFIDEVEEVFPIECNCGSREFEIMAAVALYADTKDVRWFYLGCECAKCHDSGVYADWKNEYIGFQELLDRV